MDLPRIAVVYLVRGCEGRLASERFLASYRRHTAGVPHGLVVLFKGFECVADRDAAASVFAETRYVALDLPDDGFDVGAYIRAAGLLPHETFVCLNTHAEIAAPNWLYHLTAPLVNDEVSMVGAMGSFESLFDSVRIGEAAAWKWWDFRHTVTDPLFEARFAPILGSRAPPPARPSLRRRAAVSLKRQILVRDNPAWPWRLLAAPGMPLRWLAQFPGWPNPHIRTNAFAIRAAALRAFSGASLRTKYDALAFESGREGLSSQMARRGRLLVVDKHGCRYDTRDWPKGETFRLGDQSGLCVTDNQTRAFDLMSDECRELYRSLTWSGPQAIRVGLAV